MLAIQLGNGTSQSATSNNSPTIARQTEDGQFRPRTLFISFSPQAGVYAHSSDVPKVVVDNRPLHQKLAKTGLLAGSLV